MKPLKTEEDVNALFGARAATAAFEAAISTGLLWMLTERPMDGEAVSKALSIPGKRGHYWLQYLHSFGVLDLTPQGYVPSELIRSTILEVHSRQIWEHAVLDQRERDGCVQGLSKYISEPGSLWTVQGLEEPKGYVEHMRRDPQRARDFVHLLFQVHQTLAQQVADLLDLHDVECMMDLGGNSGVVSMALLRKYPQMTSTVVDIENVCIAGREIVAEQGFSDRISYYPAEFFQDEFPTGFDLILKCDVSVFDMGLFKKLHRSLKPGGRLVFVDHFSPAKNIAPVTRIGWIFLESLHDPNVCNPTVDEVRAQLTEIGFDVSPGHQTIGRGWIVLEARKPFIS